MLSRVITFERLAPILTEHFNCSHEFFAEGAAVDSDGIPSPPIYAFTRELGLERKLSTIVVEHPKLPLFAHHIRSFLIRLELTPDDVFDRL